MNLAVLHNTTYNEFMYKVRIESDFAAAHFLRDYNGKCENLHGHNYKVFVYLRGEVLNEGGMLFDFSCLKKITKKVLDVIDHTNLNDLVRDGVSVFDQNPSAERIAFYIYEEILKEAKNLGFDLEFAQDKKEAFLYRVDVFETEKSRASFCIV